MDYAGIGALISAISLAISGTVGWIFRRIDKTKDKRIAELEEDLQSSIREAEKTDRAHREALAAKNTEIAEWRRQVERKEDRITELEDRLYTGGRS